MPQPPNKKVTMSPASSDSGSDGSSNGDPFYLEALLKKLPKLPPQQHKPEPEPEPEPVPPEGSSSSKEGDPNKDPFYLESLLRRLPKNPIVIEDDAETPSMTKEALYSQKDDARQASIMERRIETRALPNSFSGNIGRRFREPSQFPTCQANLVIDGSGHNSRKRDVEIWLEKTRDAVPLGNFETPNRKAARTPTRPSVISTSTGGWSKSENGRGSSKLYETPESKTFNAFPESPLLKTPTAPESYEQNLLDYKKLFTNRPLARCMDEDQPEGEFFRREIPHAAPKSTSVDPSVNTIRDEQKGAVSNDLDPYVSEEGVAYSASDYSQDAKVKQALHKTHQYWDNMRTHLWISDVENSSDEDGQDVNDGEEEEEWVSAPTNRLSESKNQGHQPDDARWVMVRDPSKWSYTGSMAEGNIYLGEDCPRFPELLLSPQTPPGKSTEDKLKELSEFFNWSDEEWVRHQHQAWKEYFEGGGYIHIQRSQYDTQESLEELDEFFAASPREAVEDQESTNLVDKNSTTDKGQGNAASSDAVEKLPAFPPERQAKARQLEGAPPRDSQEQQIVEKNRRLPRLRPEPGTGAPKAGF